MPDQREQRLGILDLQAVVLRSNGVRDLGELSSVADDESLTMAPQRLARDCCTGQSLELALELLSHRLDELTLLGDQQRICILVVLGLRKEVGRDESCVRFRVR